jgi:hypothetical protein
MLRILHATTQYAYKTKTATQASISIQYTSKARARN